MDNVGFVIAGYAIAVGSLGAYAARLFVRARNARRRMEAAAARTSQHSA